MVPHGTPGLPPGTVDATGATNLADPFPVESLHKDLNQAAALSLDYGNGTQNYPIPHPWNSLDLKREDLLNLSGQTVQQGVNAWEKVDQPASYEEGPCTDLEVKIYISIKSILVTKLIRFQIKNGDFE